MRHSTPCLTLAGIAALLLVACSGGGGSSSSSGGTAPNTAPVANAGANQTVSSGTTVTLNGTASSDADGTIASYAWTQTAGTTVTFSSATASQPTFSAPTVVAATTLTFSLVVTDNRSTASPASTTTVTVNPAAGNTNVTGNITFARVPFATFAQDPDRGLWYATPIQQPARGVIVRAVDPTTPTTVLATGITDNLGNYTLSVASNISIKIQVVARMLRDASQPLPRWDVRVQNGTTGNTPYTYTEPTPFNSSAGIAHNVAMPTGISAAGDAPGERPSGPFAILDTVYQAIQTVVGVSPSTNFPALIVNWGGLNNSTFFSSGTPQYIELTSNLETDTDEFDQHVIAHEFGHYIEHNFSRADNIGGSHGQGDKLDSRVAFGEGFGYAFAGIVLNDPVARDSANDNGNLWSGVFNIETNPSTTPVARTNYGCWCSESSVYSILWDVYDSAADSNDNVALGFPPIWNVLVGAQRTTPAFTTIFSFITALKSQNAGSTAAIDALVAAQNITSATIDAYGTNETHAPVEVPAIAALPVYTVATVGGGDVVLRTVDDAESQSLPDDGLNKIGDRRFVRFALATARTITITASSSNPNNSDTDFNVYRDGAFVQSASSLPAPSETLTLTDAPAGNYLIDVYDCANGCDDLPQGTSGDYDLTVKIE
jgi:uncharacterized membrane protein YdcZ (DUF606 family)